MSPDVLTAPSHTDVIKRVLARRFPRAHQQMVLEPDGLVRVPQAPEPDLLFKVTLHGRTARLLRLDPETHDAWPGAQPEDIPIPEAPTEPVPVTPTLPLGTLAERLQQAVTSARGQLQSIATTVPDEVARLQAIASTYDATTARNTLGALVAAGLAAYLAYEGVLSEALRALETVHGEQAATTQALAALRTSDNLETLGQVHVYEARAREQRLGLVELDGAVRDAAVYREAFASTAARLAVASLQAAAGLQVATVTTRLAALKQNLQALRADALVLPDALVKATQHFAAETGRAVPVPRLYWATPKDVWAPPTIATE